MAESPMWFMNTAICNEQNNEVVPQVEHLGAGYAFDAPDSVTHIRSNVPLRIPPNTRSFHLDPVTHLTDVVSQGYVYTMGLLVSNRMFDVMRPFTLQAHEAYAAEVVHHDKRYEYQWMHMTELVDEHIDFAQSRFVVRPHGKADKEVSFRNSDELRETTRALVDTIGPVRLEVSRLVFLPATPRYDFFGLDLTARLFFASAPLAERLIERRFTGFELKPSSATISLY
jgi:hypothetical protein